MFTPIPARWDMLAMIQCQAHVYTYLSQVRHVSHDTMPGPCLYLSHPGETCYPWYNTRPMFTPIPSRWDMLPMIQCQAHVYTYPSQMRHVSHDTMPGSRLHLSQPGETCYQWYNTRPMFTPIPARWDMLAMIQRQAHVYTYPSQVRHVTHDTTPGPRLHLSQPGETCCPWYNARPMFTPIPAMWDMLPMIQRQAHVYTYPSQVTHVSHDTTPGPCLHLSQPGAGKLHATFGCTQKLLVIGSAGIKRSNTDHPQHRKSICQRWLIFLCGSLISAEQRLIFSTWSVQSRIWCCWMLTRRHICCAVASCHRL